MAENIPTIATFCGVPLNEMPREELESEFVKAHLEIRRLQRENCDRSVAHIQDLAAAGRRHMEDRKGLLHRALDRLVS